MYQWIILSFATRLTFMLVIYVNDSKVLNYVLHISGDSASLKVFETENHERTNSDRNKVELPQIVIFVVEIYIFYLCD